VKDRDQDHGTQLSDEVARAVETALTRLKGAEALAALESQGKLFGFPADVADVFNKDVKVVYRALERGEIPYTRIGQRYQISVAWMRRQVDGVEAPELARRAS
jgi:hypothetical protein